MAAEGTKASRGGKASRIRERLFNDVTRFDTRAGKFSALPWVFRRIQWLFAPRTWQVLTYLIMRSGQDAVTWQTDRQIALDLDVSYRKVAPQLKQLAALGFIAIREHDAERFVCVLDPLPALDRLVQEGKFTAERLERLNEDLETIGLPKLALAAQSTEQA